MCIVLEFIHGFQTFMYTEDFEQSKDYYLLFLRPRSQETTRSGGASLKPVSIIQLLPRQLKTRIRKYLKTTQDI